METFKILTDEEVSRLSNAERRKYLKLKKAYDNQKLVAETLKKHDVPEPRDESSDKPTDVIEEKKRIPIYEKNTHAVAEVDPDRCYSPYYTPKPKLGSRGGRLGRGAVEKSTRKVQFSLTCTTSQKERFSEAAKKEGRKLPDFICMAVEEYMKNHDL